MPVKKLSDLPQKTAADNGDGFVITSVTGQDMRVPFQNLRENLGVPSLEAKDISLQADIDDLEANQLASTIGFETKALMDADLAHDAGTVAQVMNDATAANNGYYRKDGASGAGSWVKRASLYANTLDPNNTSEAVVGKAVADFDRPELDGILINGQSLFSDAVVERNFRRSILDISFDAKFLDNEYVYIWSYRLRSDVNDDLDIFFGKNTDRTTGGTTGDLFAHLNVDSLSTKTGIQELVIDESSGSGITGKIVIDFDRIDKATPISATGSYSYNKSGIKPVFWRNPIVKENRFPVAPSDLKYSNKRVLNKEQDYPLVSVGGSTITAGSFVENGILDVKIINAQRNSWYSIGYVGNNQSTYKDIIVIRRYAKSDNSLIEEITSTDYRPVLNFDRDGIVIREISANTVGEQGFHGNFSDGFQVLVTLDYGELSLGGNWNGLSEDNRISEDCILTYAQNESIRKTDNYVKRDGEDLYILSNFDGSYDWQCRFRKCMFNDLYTYQQIALIENSDGSLDIQNIQANPNSGDITWISVGSDNIGPVKVEGEFMGGNHSFQNDGLTRTARNDSFEIFADSVKVEVGYEGYADEIVVLVENTIFDPIDLPTTETDFIKEYVSYVIKGSSIDVTVKHEYLQAATINIYYGMQSIEDDPGIIFDSIYYGHSQHTDLINYDPVSDSGESQTYPDVEKVVACESNKVRCQSMTMNRDRGLGANIISNINGTTPIAKRSGSKIYFTLIENKSVSAGHTYYWNGCYSWFNQSFKQSLEANTVFAYDLLREGEYAINADFKAAESQKFSSDNKTGKTVEEVKSDISVSADDFMLGDGVKITATDKGAIIIK